MLKLEFENLNTNKFHDELIVENIKPIVTSKDNKTWLKFPDLDESESTELIAQINVIANAHDPTPVPLVDYQAEFKTRIKGCTTVQDIVNAFTDDSKKYKVKIEKK